MLKLCFISCVLLSLLGAYSCASVENGKCRCMPSQMSSVLSDLSTINNKELRLWFMQIDFDDQKQAILNYTIDPITKEQNVTNRLVQDFRLKKMYYIYGPKLDQCNTIEAPFLEGVQCIPDGAQYLGSTYLGPMAGPLEYDGYRFKIYQGALSITLALTRDTCIPIIEGIKQLSFDVPDQTLLFTSFQDKITQPELFKLPESCK